MGTEAIRIDEVEAEHSWSGNNLHFGDSNNQVEFDEDAHANGIGDGQGNGIDNILDDEGIRQLQFISWEDAESFYAAYSFQKGFIFRKRDSHRSQEYGGFIMQHWVCQKEGHGDKRLLQLTTSKQKARPKIREDCHAHLRVKLDHNINKWVVTSFESSHSHPMVEHIFLLHMYRSATSARTLHKAGVKSKQISKVISSQCGGFDNLGSNKVADSDRSSEVDGSDVVRLTDDLAAGCHTRQANSLERDSFQSKTKATDPDSDNNPQPHYFLRNSGCKSLLSDDRATDGIQQASPDTRKNSQFQQSSLHSSEDLERSEMTARKSKHRHTSRISSTSMTKQPSEIMMSEGSNSDNFILPEEIQPIMRVDPLLDLDLDPIIPCVYSLVRIEISSSLSLMREVLSKGLSEITPEIREAARSSIHALLRLPNLPAMLMSNLQRICGVVQLPGKFTSQSSEKEEFSTKLSLFETTTTLALAERRIFAKMSQEEKEKYEEYKQNREAIQNLHEQLKQLMEKSVTLKNQYDDLSQKVSAKEAELQSLGKSLCQQRNDLPSWQLGLACADEELAFVEMQWVDLQSLPLA